VLLTVLVFVMLIYMTVLLYGQMIGRSVVTEKTSKTVEIMLSSVKSQDLMFGKILGLGLAGLLQYAVWVSMAFLLTRFVGPLLGLSLPAGISTGNLIWLVVFSFSPSSSTPRPTQPWERPARTSSIWDRWPGLSSCSSSCPWS